MFWKFWEKKSEAGQPGAVKLPKPKELPDPVGRDIVTKLGKNPDWVWKLRCVLKPSPEGKSCYDFRVFSDSEAAKIKVDVTNYLSLDEHPELILFDGWYDKNSHQVKVEERQKSAQEKTA